MHLISWNVASWKTTLEHINENHCPALNHPNGSVKSSNGNSSSKAKSPGSGTGLDCWLRQLQVGRLHPPSVAGSPAGPPAPSGAPLCAEAMTNGHLA